MKRILCMLLVLLMLGAMLISCQTDGPASSDNNESGTKPSDKPSSENSNTVLGEIDWTDTDENGYLNDRLPDNVGYKGLSVSLLSWKGNEALTYPNEPGDGGNPIQESLYYHWRAVEERMGVVFDAFWADSSWPGQEGFYTAARAEDAAYDLIQTQSLFPIVLAQEGRLANLRNLDYPDLEMPWWPESVNEWTQYGALYFIGSNSSANSIANMNVIFANIQMMEEEGLGDPVKLVLRGGWTLEQMMTYSRKFAGLAEANPGEIYGIVVDEPSRLTSLYFGCGFDTCRNNASGVAELAYTNPEVLEQISNCMDQLVTMFTGVEALIHAWGADLATEMYDGRTAMQLGFMQYIHNLEDTASYAPLPYPKLDASQKNYRVIHRDYLDVWCVPIATLDKDMCGKLLEANASSEFRTVGPFYFEQYLKRRYSTDAEGMKCFDLLRNSVTYDFGRIAGVGLDWCSSLLNKQNSIISTYTSEVGTNEEALAKILENYLFYSDQ